MFYEHRNIYIIYIDPSAIVESSDIHLIYISSSRWPSAGWSVISTELRSLLRCYFYYKHVIRPAVR